MNLTDIKPFPHLKYEFLRNIDKCYSRDISLYRHRSKSLLFVVKTIKDNSFDTIQNEISIGKTIRHENFAKTLKNYHSDNKHYLIIEFIETGVTLRKFLKENEKSKISLNNLSKIIRQLFNSVMYALIQNICPGDFHANNILIDFNYTVKLIDFGCYVECNHIGADFTVLKSCILFHTTNLLDITNKKEASEFLEAWKIKLATLQEPTRDSLICHYQAMLDDLQQLPF